MITEHDLREAIAECQGVRDPTSQTCIKLAAYYTLLDHIVEPETERTVTLPSYSYAEPPENKITYQSGSEFGDTIYGKDPDRVFAILDEAMSFLRLSNGRLYNAVLDKLADV